MKKFKHPLKDSDQFIEVPLVYVIKTSEETNHEFIITEELLKEFNLPVSKFIDYLKHNLDNQDSSYDSAAQLWSSNRCFTKKQFSINRPTSRKQIIKIISVKGTEYIEPIQKKNNFNQEISRYIMKKVEKAKTFKSLIDLYEPPFKEFQLTYQIFDMKSERGRIN